MDELESQLPSITGAEFSKDGEIEKLVQENAKLVNRLQHLKQAIADEEKVFEAHSPDIAGALAQTFTVAIFRAFPQLYTPGEKSIQAMVNRPPKDSFGDYQCTSAMSLAAMLKQKMGRAMSPKDVADQICANLPPTGIVESVSATVLLSGGKRCYYNIFI